MREGGVNTQVAPLHPPLLPNRLSNFPASAVVDPAMPEHIFSSRCSAGIPTVGARQLVIRIPEIAYLGWMGSDTEPAPPYIVTLTAPDSIAGFLVEVWTFSGCSDRSSD